MDFTITEAAARRIREIVSDDGREGASFRVSVTGGGCQGFSYGMEITDTAADDDVVAEGHGATVLIDPVSAAFLPGARLDWISDLTGESFRIDNPAATSSCGCGISFSL